jgi:carbon monoxide dehydrogenase subunit G
MGMDLRHEFTVPATVEETWAAFNDIEAVALCFPGAAVSSVEGDTFHGSCKVKLGPISLLYNGTGTFVEKDEAARRMVIDAKGKDKRGNGTAGAHVTATMTEQGPSTKVEVLTDLNITGKPAQFGRGVMQDVSDKLLGQFTTCLEQRLGAPAEAPPTVAAETGTAPPVAEAGPGPVTPGGAAPEPGAPTPEPGPAVGGRMHNMRDLRPGAEAPSGGEALDLGATVLPVLARTYWKQALGIVLVLIVLRRLLRSRD